MKDTYQALSMDDFHDWIRALHVGLRRFESLFDKLSIYEHKLVTGPASNLSDSLKKACATYNPFLHWIIKIDETKEQLGELADLIHDYDQLWLLLTDIEKAILSNLITRKISMTLLASHLCISRTYLYQVRNELYQKWVAFYKNKQK